MVGDRDQVAYEACSRDHGIRQVWSRPFSKLLADQTGRLASDWRGYLKYLEGVEEPMGIVLLASSDPNLDFERGGVTAEVIQVSAILLVNECVRPKYRCPLGETGVVRCKRPRRRAVPGPTSFPYALSSTHQPAHPHHPLARHRQPTG